MFNSIHIFKSTFTYYNDNKLLINISRNYVKSLSTLNYLVTAIVFDTTFFNFMLVVNNIND